MAFSAEAAAFQVQERLKSLYNLVHEIETERQKNERNLTNITKLHERYNSEDKSVSLQQKLKSLYTAVADAEHEEELLRRALAKVNEIRSIRNERRIQARNAGNKETIRRGTLMKMLQGSAQTLPLWVGKPDEKAPALCGAVPADASYVAKPGDMVAALVKGADEEENWILAEVVQYNTSSNKYEVDDIDEEQKDRHILSKRRVVPLPLMRANPETDPHALFPKGSVGEDSLQLDQQSRSQPQAPTITFHLKLLPHITNFLAYEEGKNVLRFLRLDIHIVFVSVMALYPQTTCFYKAVVNQLPTTSTEEYEVLFEDPSYADGYSPPLTVAQRYVIAIKDKKMKNQQ